MKTKILILIIALLAINCEAQYNKIFDFTGTNGCEPFGDLIQAGDGMLYSTTYIGGTDYGVLFQYNLLNSTYTKKIDFSMSDGHMPDGSLMQASDGMLYGVAMTGGVNGINGNSGGVLFQYNPDSSIYVKKYEFSVASGDSPVGSLIQANDGMLYGMTYYGGTNNEGVLFQYNPVSHVYSKKFDFTGIVNGSNPQGSLMQASNGMIYGMTRYGGANQIGVLFQYNPINSIYTKKLDFVGGQNGANPYGALIETSDGMLYGMTAGGGVDNMGVLFQYNLINSTFIKKIDFTGTSNGGNPMGSLMQASDGMLYGMTYTGGLNDNGVIFQYDIATNTFTKKFDFDTLTNGTHPRGSLMQTSDGIFYGMTSSGGTTGCGVMFKYALTSGIIENSSTTTFIIYPNPSVTSFTIASTTSKIKEIRITNMLGEEIKNILTIAKLENTIDVSSFSKGIYYVQITDENKNVINKKVVVQ